MLKKTIYILLATFALLLFVVLIKTYLFSNKVTNTEGKPIVMVMDTAAAAHLQEAVGIPTISYDNKIDSSAASFDTFFDFISLKYPLVFKTLELEKIGRHSLLLHWKGEKSGIVKPVLLYAHLDVVPVDGLKVDTLHHGFSADRWYFDPFSKKIIEDSIRGRGTIDDKLGVIGILEATNKLIADNFEPQHDIYLAFGEDEEAGGKNGAALIAQKLLEQGIHFEWMLDEGGMVAENMVPFVKAPVALVMTAEKGYMTIDLSVSGPGGHSSFPPKESPIDILAAAITRLKDNPFESTICSPVAAFMDHIGPEMKFPFNILFLNRWLFSPIILNEYGKIAEGNAMIRTTMAFTEIHGGIKENVMPANVSATVNFRLLPGITSTEVVKYVKEIINDKRVVLHVRDDIQEPSTVSATSSSGFQSIAKTIHVVFPDAVVAPSLSIAATDSRHFNKVADNRYRFLPVRMNRDILSGMHGINEKIATRNFMESIQFYETLLRSN